MGTWNLNSAAALCRKIESVCPHYGCHVALTGGALYKDGERKDADILFYRIRQVDFIDIDGLLMRLQSIGIEIGHDYGWCVKAKYLGNSIDFFFPEREGFYYPSHDEPGILGIPF